MTLTPASKQHRANLVIEVRDLVRMDVALNGARFIIVEFALAAALAVVIGSFVLVAGTQKGSLSVILAGCFFFLWGSTPGLSGFWRCASFGAATAPTKQTMIGE